MTPAPKVLFVGCDKGAWQMRGRQIAEVLPNARYGSKPNQLDWTWPDVVVLVKRAAEIWWKDAAACGKPVIWDVLDFWRQPRDNELPEQAHLQKIAQIKREAGASVLIGATQAMATDIGGVYIPHHSRLGLAPTPPRRVARIVGYDGSPRYLGSWRGALERACAQLGLTFVLNPDNLADVDVLVAFRGGEWDGWACRQWKSGVKYVNAIAAGRPILTQPCAAAREIEPVRMGVEDHLSVVESLRMLCDPNRRYRAYVDGVTRAPEYTVQAIARRYERLIADVVRRAA